MPPKPKKKSSSPEVLVVVCPCAVCKKEVEDGAKSLQCDMCDGWCHQQCPTSGILNIKATTYDAHLADPEEPWFCPLCRKILPMALKTFKEFTEYKEQTEEFKSRTEQALANLLREIEGLKGNPQPAAPPSLVAASVNIQAEIKEALEKESKRLNLVVVGFPESNTDIIRSADDKSSMEEYATKLGIPLTDISDVFRSGRMGEPTAAGRPFSRIMKVKFTNSDSRFKFLRGFLAHRPKDSRFYIRPDMTHRERIVDRELKNALYLKRELDSEGDWIIRNGKIIKRPAKQTGPVRPEENHSEDNSSA